MAITTVEALYFECDNPSCKHTKLINLDDANFDSYSFPGYQGTVVMGHETLDWWAHTARCSGPAIQEAIRKTHEKSEMERTLDQL